jgi:hypothetical protein
MTDGYFKDINSWASFWSASKMGDNSLRRALNNNNSTFGLYSYSPARGFSVRCVR